MRRDQRLIAYYAFDQDGGWQRRLGKRWQTLHKLIYTIAILACWHFWWQVKADILEPAIYAAILAALLLARSDKIRRPKSAERG